MVDNNDSLKRAEEWGDVLNDLYSADEEHRIQVAIERVSEVPKCFEKLEERARAVTPETIGKDIKKFIKFPELHPRLPWQPSRFEVLYCGIPTSGLDVSASLSRGFGTRIGWMNRLFGHWIPVELLVLFASSLAPILLAGVIFIANLGFMIKHATYVLEDYPGVFIRRHEEINLPSLRTLFHELEKARLKPRLEIKLDCEEERVHITLTCEYSKVFRRALF